MAKILCPHCGKRMITPKILEAHLVKSHPELKEAPIKEELAPVEEVKPEEVVPEPAVEVPTPTPETVRLQFTKAVEVTINGKQYFGKTIEAPDMDTASEIVRIAREAYGNDILAQ